MTRPSFLALLLAGGVAAAATVGTAPLLAQQAGPATINLAEPPDDLDISAMPIQVVEAFPNLRIERPVVLTHAGDGSGRLFVGNQQGKIYFVDGSDSEVDQAELFLDIEERVSYKDRENEEGLLGLAFHPKFSENGQFFIYYTTTHRPHVSYLSRFQTKGDDRNQGDPDSEEVLMEIQQPFWNHNGGTLEFGPDGYLYVGLGDGGMANDPLRAGQDNSKLLGTILRLDIDREGDNTPYAIPEDNPLVGQSGVWPEIYAWGLRNVWRMAFDPKTGDLWAADVGQNDWEEVNLIRKGGNYGWNLREGARPFTLGGNPGSEARPDLIDPLVEYPHTEDWGKSVTGGAVYRGSRTPELDGYYLYGDYVSGRLWALKYDREKERVVENRPIAWQQLPVFTFGQTEDGEVLMSTMMGGGRIYRFVAESN